MMKLFPEPIGGLLKGFGKIVILGFIIIYVAFMPVDILPEAFLGPIGLIDDGLLFLFGASLIGVDIFKSASRMRKRIIP